MFAPAGRVRAAGIAAGVLADLLFGDPRRGHPVALFGCTAAAGERLSYSDSRTAGAAHAGALLAGLGTLAALVQRWCRYLGPLPLGIATAGAMFTALGGTSLIRTGNRMAALLGADDIDGARSLLPSLCGRNPAVLDAAGLARAALESVAENTSDAQVAPLLWGGVGGIPAVLVYRGANTLDAMIGNRSPRYVRFGWAAARFDDIVNFAAAFAMRPDASPALLRMPTPTPPPAASDKHTLWGESAATQALFVATHGISARSRGQHPC